MAETRVIPGLSPTEWDKTFTIEYLQQNPFAPYAGVSRNKPIVMKENFASERGNGITFEFITALDQGVTLNYEKLLGHEDRLSEYGDRVYWNVVRKGIALHDLDCDLSSIDLRKAAKDSLRRFADDYLIQQIIEALSSVGDSCQIAYTKASDIDKNVWVTNNKDRVLFGRKTANFANDMATALANIDVSDGTLTMKAVSTLKAMALQASPRITPLSVAANARRFFVAFVPTLVFKDFVESSNQIQSSVGIIDKNQEIFRGGDREFDGVILHQVDGIKPIKGAGKSGIDVWPVYLLGQEALGWAIKQRFKTREEHSDYGIVKGIALEAKWGIKKLCYSKVFGKNGSDSSIFGKQHGMVSGFFAANEL